MLLQLTISPFAARSRKGLNLQLGQLVAQQHVEERAFVRVSSALDRPPYLRSYWRLSQCGVAATPLGSCW